MIIPMTLSGNLQQKMLLFSGYYSFFFFQSSILFKQNHPQKNKILFNKSLSVSSSNIPNAAKVFYIFSCACISVQEHDKTLIFFFKRCAVEFFTNFCLP
jgi:hypothetical protein